MMDNKIKLLEFIQNIIDRMASNSARCKEFCLLICSAFVAIYSANPNAKIIILMCIVPIIIFWILDSYYLYLEKRFRYLYNEKGMLDENDASLKDFSIRKPSFSREDLLKSIFNISTTTLYVALLGLSLGFGLYLLNA